MSKNVSSDKVVKKFYEKNKIIINGVGIIVGTWLSIKVIKNIIALIGSTKTGQSHNIETVYVDPVSGQEVPITININRKAQQLYSALWEYPSKMFPIAEDEETAKSVILSTPCHLMPQLAYAYRVNHQKDLYADITSYLPSEYISALAQYCPDSFN